MGRSELETAKRTAKAINDMRVTRKIAENTFREIRRLYLVSKKQNQDLEILGAKFASPGPDKRAAIIGMSGHRILL